jgi:hypothetical protein
MTAARFGDFARQASGCLAEAAASLRSGQGDGDAAAAAGEIRRITATLASYLADLAPYDVVQAMTSGEVSSREQALVDAREAFRMAAASLDPAEAAADSEPDPARGGPLTGELRGAGLALAAGRDLLWTHFSTGHPGPALSGWSAVIWSDPVRRALVHQVVRWSQQLAVLTVAWSVGAGPAFLPQEMAHASRLLLAGTVAVQSGGPHGPVPPADTDLLMAIPARHAGPRVPPAAAESAAQLCAGIEVSAARLRSAVYGTARLGASSPLMTADSWRWSATGAAVTCHLSGKLLRALAEWASQETRWAGTASGFRDSAEAMKQATSRWRQVAANWGRMTTETGGLTGRGVPDLSDLVVRLGRLESGDPRWVPAGARGAGGPRDPDLTFSLGQARAVTAAVHHAAEALAALAAADADAVRMAARARRLYVPTRSLPSGYDVPYRYGRATPASVRDLRNSYQSALSAASSAVTALDGLAGTLGAPSWILTAARAARERVRPADLRDDPAARASDEGEVRRVDSALAHVLPPGPVEYTLRELGVSDSISLLRAKAIDRAASDLTAKARAAAHQRAHAGPAGLGDRSPGTPATVAGVSFPVGPAPSRAMGPVPGPRSQPGPRVKRSNARSG